MLISHLPGSDTVPVAFNVPSVTHHRQRFGARDEIGSSYGEAEQVIVQPHACHTTSAVQLFSNIPQNLLLRFLTSCLPHPLKGFITKVCEVTFTFFQNPTETETVFMIGWDMDEPEKNTEAVLVFFLPQLLCSRRCRSRRRNCFRCCHCYPRSCSGSRRRCATYISFLGRC